MSSVTESLEECRVHALHCVSGGPQCRRPETDVGGGTETRGCWEKRGKDKNAPPPIRGLAGQDIPDMAGLIKKHVMIKKIGGWASKQKSNEQDEKKLFPGDNFDDFIGKR